MPRTFLIFALVLPLAVLMGFMLSDPLVSSNMAVSGALIMLLAAPLIISYHHRVLIWSAWTVMIVYFIKGQPQIWMLMAMVSLVMSVLSRPLAKEKPKMLWTRSLMGATIFLVLVIVATAGSSGGIGARALGSDVYGGRRYVTLLMALVGLAALVMHRVPKENVKREVALLTLGPATAALSNVAYFLGPKFYFLYLILPADMALDQAAYDMSPGFVAMRRLTGFAPACGAIVSFCLAKWGVRGLFNFKVWRHALLLFGFVCGVFSGFRSTLVVPMLTVLAQFFTEGLYRTRAAFVLIGVAVIGFAAVAGFSDRMPLVVQRSISFLPVKIDQMAKNDADASIEWRLEMWSVVSQDVPKYFWKGKGFVIDPKDLYFAEESLKRGFVKDNELAIQAGDYHNGPLSILIPFGVWGMIGFLWFCGESFRILWNNLRWGAPEMRIINSFLFASFLVRTFFFFTFYGAFSGDMWLFATFVGVGLSVNGGMAEKAVKPRLEYRRTPQAQLVEA
jgi:hypothetical protein